MRPPANSACGRRSRSADNTSPRWASARSPSHRSTWRPRTPRSPRAGFTRSPRRSARSSCRAARRTSQPVGASRSATRVVPDWVASKVTQILEDNVSYGTGVRAAFGRPAAGKTGTTDKHADAWFVGYTPELATAVWMGYASGEIPMENVHGISVSGGSFPAQIWRLMMERTIGLRPVREFPDAAHAGRLSAVPARTARPQLRPALRCADDEHGDRDHCHDREDEDDRGEAGSSDPAREADDESVNRPAAVPAGAATLVLVAPRA